MEEDAFAYIQYIQYPDFFGVFGLDEEFDPWEDEELSDDEDSVREYPFLPLRDLVLFPQMVMPLFVGRDRSLAAIQAAEGKSHPRRIRPAQIAILVGPPQFNRDALRDEDEIGVATGLAWTAAGGDTMVVEVNLMPGKGTLTLTGQLGEIMQESAQAALTYTRSQWKTLGLPEDIFEDVDVHIHVPEGAVPKDGPSAGVALATALISAFTGRAVRCDVGMTGEITLRGRVLAVGGIREKALAARRAGIKTFIMPKKNSSDLQEIPKKLRQGLTFVEVERMNEVLSASLAPKAAAKKQLTVSAARPVSGTAPPS